MCCLGYTDPFLLPPLALLSCSGHLCKTKQRTEGMEGEREQLGGGRKLKGSGWMGGMVGRKEGSIEKERRPFDI